MDYHSRVHPVKCPIFKHDDLSSAALLGRCPEYGNTALKLRQHGLHGNPCSGRHGRHQIMAARVAHSRHSVVLRQERNMRSRLSGITKCMKCCLNPAGSPLHLKTVLLKQSGNGPACLILFKIIFRIVPDGICQLRKLPGTSVYTRLDLSFQFFSHGYLLILGSSTSRIPSPSRLKPITVSKIKQPEIPAIWGAVFRQSLPDLRILPQEAVGSLMPSPRKLKDASDMIALAVLRVAYTMTSLTVLGSIW